MDLEHKIERFHYSQYCWTMIQAVDFRLLEHPWFHWLQTRNCLLKMNFIFYISVRTTYILTSFLFLHKFKCIPAKVLIGFLLESKVILFVFPRHLKGKHPWSTLSSSLRLRLEAAILISSWSNVSCSAPSGRSLVMLLSLDMVDMIREKQA